MKRVGNFIGVVLLFVVIFDISIVNVKADYSQGNAPYRFEFESEGDTAQTASRTKWEDCDPAYIQCTNAEIDGSVMSVSFYFLSNYDGEGHTSAFEMSEGDQRWVANGAAADDTTWFKGTLTYAGSYGDYGGTFDGYWRPDSSY